MTNEPKAGRGLDPEMLAAYIDKRLPQDERAAVEAQLAADPDSYAVLVATLKAQDELGEDATSPEVRTVSASAAEDRFGEVAPKLVDHERASESGPQVHRRRWAIAGGVLAAAAAVVLVVRLQPDLLQRLSGGDVVDPRFAKLVEAVGEERYIEARLTGGFNYGPMRSAMRGSREEPQQNLSLLAAASEAQKRATEDPTGENLHAWGLAQLLLGRPDEAIESLGSAVALGSTAPAIHSDLSAAYLDRGSRQNRAEDVVQGLAAAERALAADPTSSTAAFNRALALETLHLSTQALEAWRAFIALDRASNWTEEARLRIERLTR